MTKTDEKGRRLALVTGANKGIGLEIAKGIGASGAIVLVGARDAERGEAAAADLRAGGADARFMLLDVRDPQTIENAARHVDQTFGRLDILVNNAGIYLPNDGPGETVDLDAVRETMETNFLGPVAVTQAMLPLLKKGTAARIVNISSGLGSLAQNADSTYAHRVLQIGYNASKAALNMLTVQLAGQLKEFGIAVNAAAPGYTATDINGHGGTQTVAEWAEAALRLALATDDVTGGFFDRHGSLPW